MTPIDRDEFVRVIVKAVPRKRHIGMGQRDFRESRIVKIEAVASAVLRPPNNQSRFIG